MITTDTARCDRGRARAKYGAAALTVHRHAGQDRVIGADDYSRISLDALDPFMDECPSWCSDLDRGRPHRFTAMLEDRIHLGHRTMVVLEIESASDQRDGTCIPPFPSAYLRQGADEREPHVWPGPDETDKGTHMTLDEAELLAEVLVDVVTRGRGTT